MSALVWWAIPLVITALAIAFVALRSRVAEPEPDPMAERLRLREAMERSSRRAKRSSRRSPDKRPRGPGSEIDGARESHARGQNAGSDIKLRSKHGDFVNFLILRARATCAQGKT